MNLNCCFYKLKKMLFYKIIKIILHTHIDITDITFVQIIFSYLLNPEDLYFSMSSFSEINNKRAQ